MIPPRIRGKVGTADDGKFYFEITLWDFYGESRVGEPITIGPWETEKQAHEELKKAARICCEAVEKHYGNTPCGEYMDMKAGGILRPWTEQ